MSSHTRFNLNPEPTDVQLAQFRRHKANGTTPGNPKWYERERLKLKPFEFKAGLPPRYPHIETGAEWHARHARTSAKVMRTEVVTQYVREGA